MMITDTVYMREDTQSKEGFEIATCAHHQYPLPSTSLIIDTAYCRQPKRNTRTVMSDTEPPYLYNENVVVEVLTDDQVVARAKLMANGAELCCSLDYDLVRNSKVNDLLQTLFRGHRALPYAKPGLYESHLLYKVPSLAIPITKGEVEAYLAKLGWQKWVHPYVYSRAFRPPWNAWAPIKLQGLDKETLMPGDFWAQLFNTNELLRLYRPDDFSFAWTSARAWPRKRSDLGLPDDLEWETLAVALCSVEPEDLTPRQVNDIVALGWWGPAIARPREELHATLATAETPQGAWYQGYLRTRKIESASSTASTRSSQPTSAVRGTSDSRSGSDSNINASIHTYGTKNEPSTTGIDGAGSDGRDGSNQSSNGMARSIEISTTFDDDSGFVVVEPSRK
jgi:hypothetical protein